MLKPFVYLFLVLLLFSCSKDNRWACFKSYGKEVSELRSVAPFVRVEGYEKVDVTIYQGSEQKVEVVAGEHIIQNIKTTVADGILKIEDKNTCNFVRGYKHTIKVNVTMPYIVKATNNGVGTIVLDAGFNQDSLSVRAESSGDIHINGTYKKIQTSSHGNGDIYISGVCDQLFVYANGVNFLQAYDLTVTGYVFIATLSLGDCNINVDHTGLVQYDISSDGNIHYKGNPGNINGTVEPGAKGRALQVN